jgi:hypothetical protein
MTLYADLEISLRRRDTDTYALELRFSQPESDADVRLMSGGAALVRLEVANLRQDAFDSKSYGSKLGQSLFANPVVQTAFALATSNAQSREAPLPLRVRLFIDANAPELHALRWETMRHPQDGNLLFTGEDVLFSRYLSSRDWRPVGPRSRQDLRALLVVANATNLSEFGLDPIDASEEFARAQAALGDIPVMLLPNADASARATLNNLVERLRDGYDILYLVCHGRFIEKDGIGEPWLWLEDENGTVTRVAGGELVTRLKELSHRPRLVVLASCQSAGRGIQARSGDEGALAALGPRLAVEAGIPAILAMQGNVSLQTIAKFMPVFFKELQKDGQIDRAMAVARGSVREQPDYWAPVLYMRLKSGQIAWYVPGFADDPKGFKKWPTLLNSIRQGRCTPILGPGLVEGLLGSSRELAQSWARAYNFPLAPYQRDDLPQVAQYVAINQDEAFVRDQLAAYVRAELLRRYGAGLPENLRTDTAPLDQLVEAVGLRRWETDMDEPHRVLSRLPFPLYITANSDELLARALARTGKDPQVILCPWNEELAARSDSAYDEQTTAAKPLVYHLLGSLREPDSLVLTEDNYFDYLIGVTLNRKLIPHVVGRALTDSSLIFLGFKLTDWNFRVLFRTIMSLPGRTLQKKHTHIAVQIDPDADRALEPERARDYLKDYFHYADINIFWGSVEDFVKELNRQWNAGAVPAAQTRPEDG